MKKLRVLLVDDEIMIREGFKRLFDWAAHDCEVVGEAADGMEALSRIAAIFLSLTPARFRAAEITYGSYHSITAVFCGHQPTLLV